MPVQTESVRGQVKKSLPKIGKDVIPENTHPESSAWSGRAVTTIAKIQKIFHESDHVVYCLTKGIAGMRDETIRCMHAVIMSRISYSLLHH